MMHIRVKTHNSTAIINSDTLVNTIFFGLIFLINFSLYYHYIFIGNEQHYSSDLVFHVSQIKHFWHQPKLYFEPGFHVLTALFAWLFLLDHKITATLLITGMQTVTAYIYYRLFETLIMNHKITMLVTATLIFASTIYIPFVSKYFLIGTGSPSIWHNPTLIMVKPFAIIITYLTAKYLESDMPISKGIAIGILLLISSFFKPCFSEVFIPALTVYGFIFYPRTLHYVSRWFLVIFPTTLLLVIQLLLWRHVGARIAFAPGLVIGLFTDHYLLAFLRTCAFPLAILVFRRPFKNKALMLSWVFTVLAYLQFLLLAEMPMYMHGNFGWGFNVGLSLIMLFSMMEFVKWCKGLQINTTKNILWTSSKLQITSFLLLAHLMTGLVWFTKIFFGGSYY